MLLGIIVAIVLAYLFRHVLAWAALLALLGTIFCR